MGRFLGSVTAAGLAAALLASAAGANPAAWRVSGSAGELLLLGSVHYLREEDYPLPTLVDRLYAEADALVMEIDLDDLEPLASQTAFVSAALLPEGTGLRDTLRPDVYRLAERRAGELGIDLGLLERFEPWLVAITLLNGGMVQRGIDPESGVEQYLLAKARADEKEIQGLETLATQIAVFDDLPVDEQEALLEQTLTALASPDAAIDELIDAWRDGRLESLAAQLAAEFAAFPSLYDAIVVERNAAWIEPLERLLDSGQRYLVVVGALHLVGERNVIELLRARGYAVEAAD